MHRYVVREDGNGPANRHECTGMGCTINPLIAESDTAHEPCLSVTVYILTKIGQRPVGRLQSRQQSWVVGLKADNFLTGTPARPIASASENGALILTLQGKHDKAARCVLGLPTRKTKQGAQGDVAVIAADLPVDDVQPSLAVLTACDPPSDMADALIGSIGTCHRIPRPRVIKKAPVKESGATLELDLIGSVRIGQYRR